jgi:fumarylacetoacetate (FAA) hydrolase family protein
MRYEGRYNNAAAPIGPFIRTLDDTLSVNDLEGMNIDITAHGDDGFTLSGTNSMGLISRDIEELVSATIGRRHQYPDGMVFTGTMFALTQDRDASGKASPTEWGTS